MQTLFLIRHGQAEPAMGRPDAERALTEHGRQEVLAMASSLPSQPDLFFASPYTRAQQTAQLIAEHVNTQLITSSLITPEGLPSAVDKWLQSQSWSVAIMVSHQPLVGMLAEFYSGIVCRQFPTAGAVCLQAPLIAKGCADLNWV